MKADTLNPHKLFGYHVRYVVPLFQRPYVWTLDKQWQPLWTDVESVAEQLLDAAAAGSKVDVPPHFLGAIVLDQVSVQTGHIQTRYVIDGQQRLTTLQVLLDAVQLVTQKHGQTVDAKALGRLVLNDRDVAVHDDDVFKVWPTNVDRPAFRAVMTDGVKVPKALRKSPIAEAHEFLSEQAAEWAETSGDPEKAASRLAALAMALSQYLRMVVIDLESGDNAQVIFETLNDRGTPLLAADLVKNVVFQEAEREGIAAEPLYTSAWEPFDSVDWRRRVRQGRLKRPRIDVLLNNWLAMRNGREVIADRLFTEFKTFLAAEPGRSIRAVVDDINQTARVFESLDELAGNSTEGTFVYRVLEVMEQNVWGPVLLWLFSWDEDQLPASERNRFLTALESWSVRRMLTRQTTKALNKTVFDVLERVVEAGPSKSADVLIGFIKGQSADSSYLPTDDELRVACQEEELYRRITRSRLRMVLEALEDSYRSPKSEQEFCPRGELTIEHIMPQGWREHWPLPVGASETAAIDRDQLTHTLGNLTLVNAKLNPSMSNRPWTDEETKLRNLKPPGKRGALADHSVLKLNADLVQRYGYAWSDGDVVARGAELATRVIEIWPIPMVDGSA